ncbi:hypothetical protein LVJ94_22325 [Pendulispora rubella]|uniref:Uncharacterized protein n=1 Tax=Pendulispora rubella TaxID=2741070 RepID=A0ABZ2LG95_9BACT
MLACTSACMLSWDTSSSQAGLDADRKILGTISGLAGSGLVLTNASGDEVYPEPGATSFEFPIRKGQSYAVTVKSPPRSPVQNCVVANSVGTGDGQDVTNVVVVCTTLGFTVNAEVRDLMGSLALSNGVDTLVVQRDGVQAFPPLRKGQSYAVTIASQPSNQQCTVTGGSGVMDEADVVVPIRCIDSFVEGFDASPVLPSGWKVALITASGSTLWHVSNDGADSAPNCARVSGAATTLDMALVSPAIAIVGENPQVKFRHAYMAEAGYDGAVLEIQVEDGAWVDIEAAGGSFSSAGYTGMITSGFGVRPPLAGRNAWTGNSGGYVTTVANLPPKLAGKKVTLRWRWGNDGSGTAAGSGWRIDNVAVYR